MGASGLQLYGERCSKVFSGCGEKKKNKKKGRLSKNGLHRKRRRPTKVTKKRPRRKTGGEQGEGKPDKKSEGNEITKKGKKTEPRLLISGQERGKMS